MTLPIARAVACVRPVSTEVELAAVGRTLRGSAVSSDENWQRRFKATRIKVMGGAAASLAEVVRDAGQPGGRMNARKQLVGLSLNERRLYLTARKLLADEIGASRGIESGSADEWIGDQLARNLERASSGETVDAPPVPVGPAETVAAQSGRRARRRRL